MKRVFFSFRDTNQRMHNKINTADAAHLPANEAEASIKRAFRYNLMPFSATVSADQQQAATVEVHPIRVVMAKLGVELTFERPLQLQSDAEMQVEFHSAKEAGNLAAHFVIVAGAAGIILLLGLFSKGWKSRD